jgi:hypothetical protein
MKKFKDFETKQQDDETPTADNVVNIIANSLNRASSNKNTNDSKSILMLIAALGLLNLSKDGLPLSVARRLATTTKK